VDAVEEPSPIEVQTPGNSGSPDRPLVLVAEDHPDMRRLISEALGEEWRIVSAGDGAEALTKALAETPDLVVTDLMSPKLGGARLVSEMRSREPLAQVPVLVL